MREIPDATPSIRASIVAQGAEKEIPIATSVSIATSVDLGYPVDNPSTGAFPGAGTYFCASCGTQLSLRERDELPECPRCGASEYRRDSMFEAMQEHGATVEMSLPTPTPTPDWLSEAREALPGPGRFLVLRREEAAVEKIDVFQIEQGWTRIGRSANADIRLDDPSVSRRHALIVSEQPDSLRVLDDRSLNGVFLNGEVVEWGRLSDGDELAIGRYRLFALES